MLHILCLTTNQILVPYFTAKELPKSLSSLVINAKIGNYVETCCCNSS